MRKLYIITGAAGHLGSTIIRQLCRKGAEIRGLILPEESTPVVDGVTYYRGDVRDIESLRPLFENTAGREVDVIHAAGIVDITGQATPFLKEVNVGGTQNIIELCRAYRVQRLVYVSSVHAIPEVTGKATLHEIQKFSATEVVGGYAQTKAEATQRVLDAAAEGLNAVVVHPSGILGPYDMAHNHLVQLISDYIGGRLPACVRGGYDFVDVRDVANGCLQALERGRSGECYILSNRHYEVCDLLKMVRKISGGRKLPVLPMWVACACIPGIQLLAKLKKSRPLFTRYSLHTLQTRNLFSHQKATDELNYHPRDLSITIRDTIRWLRGSARFCALPNNSNV